LDYKVLIPKTEITDRDALWNKVKGLVKKCAPTNQSGWSWGYRDDEIVYGFDNHGVAVLFTIYCANQGIRFRVEQPTES
jgi:hypothetical protein